MSKRIICLDIYISLLFLSQQLCLIPQLPGVQTVMLYNSSNAMNICELSYIKYMFVSVS